MVVTCPGCRSQLQVPDEVVASTLRCTQCQTQFRVGDAAAPGAPPAPAPAAAWGPPPGPPPPPAPRGTSAAAVTSLILGIVGLLTCCLAPLLAIPGGILGFVGISATGAGKKGGRAMAIIGLVLNAIGFLIVIPGGVVLFKTMPDWKCMVNMAEMSTLAAQKPIDIDDFPAGLQGHDLLVEWGRRNNLDESKLRCPKTGLAYRGPRRGDGVPAILAACSDHKMFGQDFMWCLRWNGEFFPAQRGQTRPGFPSYEDVLESTSP